MEHADSDEEDGEDEESIADGQSFASIDDLEGECTLSCLQQSIDP